MTHCDMNFDENVRYVDKEKKGFGTTKQLVLEIELRKNSPSAIVIDTQKTSKVVVEKPEVEQVRLEQALRRSSITIRVPNRHRLIKKNQSSLMRPYNWKTHPSGNKSWMMG